MRPVAATAAIALACWGAAGCPKTDAPADAPRPSSRIAPVQKFAPPSDGLLTDRQIDRYLAVRRAARGRTEADAASALGADPDEHAWVRARVLEATIVLDQRRVRAASSETYARTIAQLHETRSSVRDAGSLRSIDEQIAALERERASWKKLEPPLPAVEANARRVEKRRGEIDASTP
ncbi:MAG: hypothetical protein ACRD00_06230 [Thermoanaerobaculia bacterium]